MLLREKLFRLKAGRTARKFDSEFREALDFSRVGLETLNWRRRVSLVKHCQIQIPYYRELFKSIGLDYRDIRTESDFQQIPILEKAQIRENEQAIVSEAVDQRRLKASVTGGTTGAPLRVFSDADVPLSVMTWRMLKMWGVDVSDNSGYLYRAVPRGLRKRFSDIALFPTRRAYLAAAEMNRAQMERFYKQLHRIQPKYLVGYVGALDAFADFLQTTGKRLPSLEVVWTTAAPLPELKRSYLREVYDCPVYTQYGCVETFMIAAESPEMNGLYVYSDIRHVEIVNGNQVVPVGTLGDVLVTDLTNYAFPLLRYRLGDQSRLIPRDRSSKLPFPRMDYVKGRISDNIKLPDGTAIAGEFWTTIFDDFPDDIKSFQILQKKDYSIEVSYEPKGTGHTKAIEIVDRNLKERMGNSVPICFIQKTINNNENGKTRFVKSELF